MALENLIADHIAKIAGELEGLKEVAAIATTLQEADNLQLTKEQIDYLKRRLMDFAETSKRS